MVVNKQNLLNICSKFNAPIKYCFGYGSGVFSQGIKSETSKRQIDMVFGVENARQWHEANIKQFPKHYSSLKYLGSGVVSWVQNNIGAGVYYNPYVNLGDAVVKYGVVELKTLERDLQKWDTLYLAGRMQKPVRIIKDCDMISNAQKQNLKAAMATALLLLPTNFSEMELYMKIASVSYMGDVRMAFAENPMKIQNIVNNQFAEFRRLYLPLMPELKIKRHGEPLGVGPMSAGIPLSQLEDNHVELCGHLPPRFKSIVTKKNYEVRKLRVSNAVARIIKYPSFTQSLKGLLTAGVVRSLWYSVAKLGKRFA